jgi:hypothetical protein
MVTQGRQVPGAMPKSARAWGVRKTCPRRLGHGTHEWQPSTPIDRRVTMHQNGDAPRCGLRTRYCAIAATKSGPY